MYLIAKVEFMKMSTPQEKAQCVSWFIETKSDIQTQRNFRPKYGRKPPTRPAIHYFTTNLPLVDMLERTWQEIEYRLDIVCATDGAHAEVY